MYCQWACLHREHLCMCTWLDTDQTDTQSTHMYADKSNGLTLLPTLDEQDGGLQVKIYIHTHICICTHRCTHTHACKQRAHCRGKG